MTRLWIAVGLVALLGAPSLAADGFTLKDEGWIPGDTYGTAIVRITNKGREPNLTWLRVDCTAKQGLRRVIAHDFAFVKWPIQPGDSTTARIRVNLYGGDADRAECEVFLTDKTAQSEYERRLR